jgi:hypothetical protein
MVRRYDGAKAKGYDGMAVRRDKGRMGGRIKIYRILRRFIMNDYQSL